MCPIPIFVPALTSSKQALDTFPPPRRLLGRGGRAMGLCSTDNRQIFYCGRSKRKSERVGEGHATIFKARLPEFRPVNLRGGGLHGCIDRIDKGIDSTDRGSLLACSRACMRHYRDSETILSHFSWLERGSFSRLSICSNGNFFFFSSVVIL